MMEDKKGTINKEIFVMIGGMYIYGITPLLITLLLFQHSGFGYGIFSIVMWIIGIISYIYTNTDLLISSESN